MRKPAVRLRRVSLVLGTLQLGGLLSSCSRVPPTFARLAPSDTTTPASAHHALVFSEVMNADGGGAVFVALDSGVVYRLYLTGGGGVMLSARDPSQPPPHYAPILFGERGVPTHSAVTSVMLDARPVMLFSQAALAHLEGFPFEVAASGEYRIEASRGPTTGDYRFLTPIGADATALVRIYREEADNLSALCVADPNTYGCRNADNLSSRPQRRVGVLGIVALLLLPLVALGFGH